MCTTYHVRITGMTHVLGFSRLLAISFMGYSWNGITSYVRARVEENLCILQTRLKIVDSATTNWYGVGELVKYE